ncbi:hypothetical protein [[Mycoplasma] gypis]|uniref:Uncharacterized protein n=1 Tax=[Mycoplasma] gypis TaxID=92404 RepID=A0ABZ2RQ83_9BACT|nr:hypothetical protein [[Mycoplasma] gypis]MBN0919457.1 hypothetical protein [[Mycoplasma] gypis]
MEKNNQPQYFLESLYFWSKQLIYTQIQRDFYKAFKFNNPLFGEYVVNNYNLKIKHIKKIIKIYTQKNTLIFIQLLPKNKQIPDVEAWKKREELHKVLGEFINTLPTEENYTNNRILNTFLYFLELSLKNSKRRNFFIYEKYKKQIWNKQIQEFNTKQKQQAKQLQQYQLQRIKPPKA